MDEESRSQKSRVANHVLEKHSDLPVIKSNNICLLCVKNKSETF